jgi:hypothetical protein
MFSVVKLIIIMLCIYAQWFVVILSAVMSSVIELCVVILSAVILSVIILSAVVQCFDVPQMLAMIYDPTQTLFNFGQQQWHSRYRSRLLAQFATDF